MTLLERGQFLLFPETSGSNRASGPAKFRSQVTVFRVTAASGTEIMMMIKYDAVHDAVDGDMMNNKMMMMIRFDDEMIMTMKMLQKVTGVTPRCTLSGVWAL